jgi:penicillin-binding protein 2
MKPAHPNERRWMGTIARGTLLVALAVLGMAFYRAQVVRGPAWALQSDSNRLRVLPVPAPRGTVFDRNGRIVAENVPSYSVSLFPATPDSIQGVLHRLQPILNLSDRRMETLMEDFRRNRRQPLMVKMDAPYEEVAALEERRPDFPGVFLEMRPKRRYLEGPAVGHVLGYVGEISAQELASSAFEGYERGMLVGKDGLERYYEPTLQGEQGVRFVEVDAVGRIVGSFEGQAAAPALPGEDLHLHLDLELQAFIHEIFPDTLRGAVVALNVADGGILALYSAPGFDPNLFVGGIDRERWDALNQDPDQPLFNRAAVGTYPPASTWKLASAAIGLELGVVSPGQFMPEPCTGSFRFQNVVRRCWEARGHGRLDLAGAVAHSCNVYFYQLGIGIGLERLVREGTRLGFGERCGVDLPREGRGRFPESLDWWQRAFNYRPFENEVLSLVIGQGPNDQTPLKMAQFYLALARDGSAPSPRLAQPRNGDGPGLDWALDLGEGSVAELRRGLRQVTSAGGTAFLSSLELWDFIGKTGSAQAGPGRERLHAWFAGMAGPRDGPPEIVLVVLVEEVGPGQGGSSVAAPIAAKAADFHLRRRHGVPVQFPQTLGEHLRAGVPAPWARWAPRPD